MYPVGKTEWDGCGSTGQVRLRRLDRERAGANETLDGALRGTRIRVDHPLEDGAAIRLRPSIGIERI